MTSTGNRTVNKRDEMKMNIWIKRKPQFLVSPNLRRAGSQE